MARIPLWQVVAVVALVLGAALSLLKPITLGLDLQGGAMIVMEIEKPAFLKDWVAQLRDDVREKLRENKIALIGSVGTQSRGVLVRPADLALRDHVRALLQSLDQRIGGGQDHRFVIADVDEGLTLTLTDAALREGMSRAISQSIDVLNRRLNASGTKETNVQRLGSNRILIEAPGVQDTGDLKKLVGTTAKLTFQLAANENTPESETETLTEPNGKPLVIEKRVMVAGEDLVDAGTGFDQDNRPAVTFRFNFRGAQRFGEATNENVGRRFAIVLDHVIISAPKIETPILEGNGQIRGDFSVEEANRLAILLRSGALPAKLISVQERTIGPGLGQDSIDAGKRAAFVAGLLVFAYMLLTYGLFGLFANVALFVHILFIFAAMIGMGATLTLPGVAGIVFTMGVAVDANVLIYERIREEYQGGRTIMSALEAGFQRALATIVDSNVTMFVVAVILYLFGSGAVRGFAVSLGLGILTSMITAVTMTRMMIALWYRRARPQALPI